jgi:hypothetical protein
LAVASRQGLSGLFRWLLSQHDGELGLAGLRRIIESRAFTITLGGHEKKPLLGTFGKPYETGLAIGIGSGLKIQFVQTHESISDVHPDIGSVDGLGRFICNGEISGARAEAGIDFGYGFRVDRRGCERRQSQRENGNGDGRGDGERRVAGDDSQHKHQNTPGVDAALRANRARQGAFYVKYPLALRVLVTNGYCRPEDATL